MSEIGFLSQQKLRDYAQNADQELRLEQGEIKDRAGTWHGRLSREIKIITGEDRTQKREAYRGAQQAVLDSLREAADPHPPTASGR